MDFFFCSSSDSHLLLAPLPAHISLALEGSKVKMKAMREVKTNITEFPQG